MKQSLFVLQAFRGLAAVSVVVYHVSHSIFDTKKYWPQRPFGDVFKFSHAGVEFFFVLSGFIIFAVHRRDVGQPDRFGSFAWKRIRRIYPAYWIVLIVIIPMFYFVRTTGTGMERNPAVWLDSFLLVHVLRAGGQVLSVSWTLFHEVMFYAVFSLVILSRRVGGALFLAWMVGSLVTYLHGPGWPEIISFYFFPMHLLFAMGIFAAWATGGARLTTAPLEHDAITSAPALVSTQPPIHRARDVRSTLSRVGGRVGMRTGADAWQSHHALTIALLGVAIFGATAVAEDFGTPPSATVSLSYGLGSALLIIGLVERERAGRLRVPAPLVLLGDASYSIYLLHILALSFCTKLIRQATTYWSLPLTGIFMLLIVLGIAAGLVYHLLVEAPLLSWLGGHRLRRTGPSTVGASGQA